MKSILRVLTVLSYFGLIFFLFLSLNSYALAEGPEKTGEEALKAEAEKALQAKVDRLKSDYADAVSLYNQGRYQEARNMFLRIAADAARNDLDPSNDLYLGYRVEQGLRKFLERSEQKIAQATEEARKMAEAEAKQREEEEARRKAEADRAYKEKVEKVLKENFQTAERLYKQKRFLEAKPILRRVARQKEATGVSLGRLADRRLASYLSNIDRRIAGEEEWARKEAEAEAKRREKEEAGRKAEEERKRLAEERRAEQEAGKKAAEAEHQRKEKIKQELLAQYDKGVALYGASDYLGAKKAFEEVAKRKDEEDIELGWIVKRGLTSYLAKVDAKIKGEEGKAAEERRLAQEEEKRRAEAAEARARQEKFARLKARYEEAMALYKEGKYQEAKQNFISVQRDKGGLDLGPEIEGGLKKYLARIDEDIRAPGEREQVAKLEVRAQVDQQRRKALAKLYYRDAKANYDRRVFNRAREDVKRALEFDPQHKEAATLLARIEAASGSALPEREAGGSSASRALEKEKVLRQRYEKVLSEEFKRAKALVAEEKYEEALPLLKDIKTQIQFAPIPPSDVIDKIKKELKVLLPQVQAKALEAQRLRRQRALERAREIAEMEREKWEEIREEQIFQEIELAKLFMERKEFDKAEAILKAILMQDSTEPRSLVLLEVVRTEKHMDRMAKLREESDLEIRKHKELAGEIGMPYRELIVYPSADIWRLLTARRKAVPALGLEPPSAADLKVEENLKQFITFDFTDTPFGDVIDFLRTVGDINIVIDYSVVTPADLLSPINLRLTDVAIESALKHILAQMALDYVVKDGALFISDKMGLQDIVEPTQAIYDIRDLTAPVTDFIGPSMGFGGGDGGGGGFGDGGDGGAPGFGSAPSTGRMNAFPQERGEEVPFEAAGVGVTGAAITPEQAGIQTEQIIRQVIDPDIWLIAGNSIRYREGYLIVTAPPATHRKIQQLLDDLRKERAIQISMDIRFVQCTDEFIEQVGVDWDAISFGDWAEQTPGFDYTPDTGYTPLSAPWLPITGGHGLNIWGEHTWGDWSVSYFLNLVQKSRQAKLMTAPRITLFNGQRGYFAQTHTQTYISNMEVEIDITTTPLGQVEEITVSTETDDVTYGVVFDVRPTVSADRLYVQMDLAPTMTSVSWELFTSADFGATVPVILDLGTTHITEVRDTVSVPDGGTILVGGIFQTEEDKGETGVPVLSKLPLIGWLFGRKAETYSMDNMLILITPHIILQPEEEDKLLKEAL